MGHGSYSSSARVMRASSLGYTTKSREEIFKNKQMNSAMSPYGIDVRESRDSEEHPNSVAVILGLDVTGSMGSVPHFLVKEGLPEIMETIIKKGVADPQVLFLGIGDHVYDGSPLQVGQFESSDELLDKWLTDLYLEGGGGGNDGESYFLAWYFAGYHTSIDCLEKRGHKGILITIGDEPVLKCVPKSVMNDIMGNGEHRNYTSAELLEKAREKYDVYHIHVREAQNGRRPEVIDGWKQIMGDGLIIAERRTDISGIISDIVSGKFGETLTAKESDPPLQEDMML